MKNNIYNSQNNPHVNTNTKIDKFNNVKKPHTNNTNNNNSQKNNNNTNGKSGIIKSATHILNMIQSPTNQNIEYESSWVFHEIYKWLSHKICKEPLTGKQPLIKGQMAIATWLLPDRFVKTLLIDREGLNELVRSLQMQKYKLGPIVLDAYLCEKGSYGEKMQIEYELLDGTMIELLRNNINDPSFCIKQLKNVQNLCLRAHKIGLIQTDFHYGNIMYKKKNINNNILRWYFIDFRSTIRLKNNSKNNMVKKIYDDIEHDINRLKNGNILQY